MNGGCFTWDGSRWLIYEECEWHLDRHDPSITSCPIAVSDYIFEFLAGSLCTVMLLLAYLLLRHGGSLLHVRGDSSLPSAA